jgi:hypothetical protein
VSVDFSEVEPVVQSVLNSLSSSIGKEYSPQIFISKRTRIASMAYKKMLDVGESNVSLDIQLGRKSQHKSYYPPPPDEIPTPSPDGSRKSHFDSNVPIRHKSSESTSTSSLAPQLPSDRQSLRVE